MVTPSLSTVRRELIVSVARETQLHRDDAAKLIHIVFSGIRHLLLEGKRVHIREFGALYVSERRATSGRNPRTGEVIEIAARKKASFKAATSLKQALLGDEQKTASQLKKQTPQKKKISQQTVGKKPAK